MNADTPPAAPAPLPETIIFGFNDPDTEFFFSWVTQNNPDFDRKAEVAKALAGVAGDPEFLAFGDSSWTARRILADRLDELLDRTVYNATEGRGSISGGCMCGYDGTPESLAEHMLVHAAMRVDTGRVAEALLRLERKYSPERYTSPEDFEIK